MFVYSEKTQSHKGPAEIGPRPWHHRSDCFICRKQEGMETLPTGATSSKENTSLWSTPH
jgi:hypothetical protein